MDEQNKNAEEKTKFSKLLAELVANQAILMKIDAQLAIREGKDQIDKSVEAVRKEFSEQAKRFGANLQKIEQDYAKESEDKKEIIEQFQQQLDSINGEYDSILQEILEKRQQLEADEVKTMIEQKENKVNMASEKKEFEQAQKGLKAEIARALKENNVEAAQQKMEEWTKLVENNPLDISRAHNVELQTRREELKKAIDSCKEEYEKAMQERKRKIEEIIGNKDKQLTTVSKQNIFAKVLGNIFNKFNGAKKFIRSVMEPFKVKVEQIRNEEVPKIKAEVEDKKTSFVKKVTEKRMDIEKTAKDKVSEYADKLAKVQETSVQKISQYKKVVTDKLAGVKAVAQDKVEIAKTAVVSKKDAILKGLQQRKDKAVKFGKETGHKAVEKINDSKEIAGLFVTNTIENGKKTYRGIINKGTELKSNIISAFQKRIADQQQQIEQKTVQLNARQTSEGRE